MKRITFVAILFATLLSSDRASAGVWLEFLYAPCWTAQDDNNDGMDDVNDDGEYEGALDCFNKDFNGDGERHLLSIKAFQAWELGTFFMYYDITGPFNAPDAKTVLNERGGFFGAVTATLSLKKIAEKIAGTEQPYDWGALADLSLKYELEHVSKFGALHYYGLQYDLAVPGLDFASVVTVIRDDRSLDGIDLQVGGATQKSFSIGPADFIVGGFFSWGLFGEGEGYFYADDGTIQVDVEGNSFFLTQPQILFDLGKPIGAAKAKLYVGLEWQFSLNRYLIEDKTENTLQGMIRWNI